MKRKSGSGSCQLRVLRAVCAVLPPESREEQFDEWSDEIQCAQENGLSAGQRTLSIAVRSVPRLAWRDWWFSRRRRGRHPTAGAVGRGLPQRFRRSWALTAGKAGWIRALSLALVVASIDIASKALVSGSLLLFERQHPLPHLTIFPMHNPGVSLAFINGGVYIPAALSVIGGSLLLLNLVAGPPRPRMWLIIGLMLGGAFGNLSERVYHGYVTDFLQIGTVPAVFNFADVAVGLAFVLCVFPGFTRARSNGGRGHRGVRGESASLA